MVDISSSYSSSFFHSEQSIETLSDKSCPRIYLFCVPLLLVHYIYTKGNFHNFWFFNVDLVQILVHCLVKVATVSISCPLIG
jgi:hypothetical protein